MGLNVGMNDGGPVGACVASAEGAPVVYGDAKVSEAVNDTYWLVVDTCGKSELKRPTCRMPGSRSAKCLSRAVLLSLASTKEAAARAASIRI